MNAIQPHPPLDSVHDLPHTLAAVALPAVLTTADAVVVAALVAGLIGGSFGVYQWRRSGPQAEATIATAGAAVAAAGAEVIERMEARLARLELRISDLETELADEKSERQANEIYRVRYESLPEGWTRFDEFLCTGILAFLNQRLEAEHGIVLLLYLDDDSETIATGFDIIRAEEALRLPFRLSPAQIAERERNLRVVATNVRAGRGFN